MHAIIETKHQLDQLNCCTTDNCFIQLIPSSDNYHPKLTNISCIYYRCKNSKGYILPINHTETFNLQWNDVLKFLKRHKIIHVIDKKFHLYFLPSSLPITDIQFKILNKDNKTIKTDEYDTLLHTNFYREHYFRNNLNDIIPIVKHFEKWESIFNEIEPFLDGEINNWFDNEYTNVFKQIEYHGIKIQSSKFSYFFEPTFEDYSIYKQKIHTLYNLYNITTRPTNAFNNINFAALPKENGARKSLIPQNDCFIEYDFKAYHPSIISKFFNYKLTDSPYAHLGKILNTSEQDAKEITFQNIYGGVKKELRDKPFFKQVYKKTYEFWTEFEKNGLITLPNGRIILNNGEFNPSKLFNYYIQALETISNVEILQKILKYLEDKKSTIVLYVYDSILLDFNKEDGISLVNDLKNILESTGYIVKMKKENNYDFKQ